MQAMDELEEPELPMPNAVSITSDTTPVDVKLRPPGYCGRRVELVLRLEMTECHTWLGIGGRTEQVLYPRHLSRKVWLALDDGGPDDLQSGDGDDCRRLIGGAIQHSLRKEEVYRCLTPAYWDQAVPVGLERAIAIAALRHGGGDRTLEASVDINVRFEFVYSEPQALLLACDEKDGGGLTGRGSGNVGDDGEAPSCSICFNEMLRELADEVTDLPVCAHSFHRSCVAAWFHKASTCPVCRLDQLHYLPLDYQDLHDEMTTDTDSLLDYLY